MPVVVGKTGTLEQMDQLVGMGHQPETLVGGGQPRLRSKVQEEEGGVACSGHAHCNSGQA